MYLTERSLFTCRNSFPAGSSQSNRTFESQQKASALWATLAASLVFAGFALLTPSLKAQNLINTVVGGAAPGGAATAADIPGPTSVAEDAFGNIYIASPASYYVFKVQGGNVSVFAGTGIQGFSGENGPATAAKLNAPTALAFDNAGNLYIADLNRVRCVLAVVGGCLGSSASVGSIVTVAGGGPFCAPSTDPCGDGGPAGQALLDSPQALAVDNLGNLYIADTQDQRIRMVSQSTGNITTIAGNGKICDGPTNTCGDKAAAVSAQFDTPTGVAVDANGNVYVGDTRNQRIRLITASTGIITTYAGTGQLCAGPTLPCGDGGPAATAHLFNPSGISLDSQGNLYLVDQIDQRVRCVIAVAGGCSSSKPVGDIVAAAGSGYQGFSGDGASAKTAGLDLPYAVLVDSTGKLWISDTGNQRIRRVSGGNISTFAGGGSGGDGGPPSLATLASPTAVAWDASGNYYIADTANNRIRKVTGGPSPAITTVAGNGNLGYSPDGTAAIDANLYSPGGVAVDASGNLFIADTANYVVRKVDAGTLHISTVAGTPGDKCTPSTAVCGDGGLATLAQLTNPTALAVDGNGNLYIADYFGNRVRVVNLNSGMIASAAGTGVRGHNGDGIPANTAWLNHPYGVAVDGSGNIYISDSNANRVRCVLAVSLGCGGSAYPIGTIITFAFTGSNGFSGDGGAATKAKMTNPFEVATDPAGNLYVGGGADSVVRRIDAGNLTITTVAGNPSSPGTFGFAGDGGPATSATLDNIGLSVNGSESLLIADTGNNRIREVDMVPVLKRSPSTLNFPATTVGQTSPSQNIRYDNNSGAADQVLGTFSLTGNYKDFKIVSTTCGSVLAPHNSCTVTLAFAPIAKGSFTAHLVLSGSTLKATLTGTGQ
ncbi:MAG: choice-of-anchor D domain-containing protein [Terriglobales bacterium]